MTLAVRFTAAATAAGFVLVAVVAVVTAAPGAPLTVIASALGTALAWFAAPNVVRALRECFGATHRIERCRAVLAAVPGSWLREATGEDPDYLALSSRHAQALVRAYNRGMPAAMVRIRV